MAKIQGNNDPACQKGGGKSVNEAAAKIKVPNPTPRQKGHQSGSNKLRGPVGG